MDLDVITNILWLSLVSLMAIKRVLQCMKVRQRKKVIRNERERKTNNRGDN